MVNPWLILMYLIEGRHQRDDAVQTRLQLFHLRLQTVARGTQSFHSCCVLDIGPWTLLFSCYWSYVVFLRFLFQLFGMRSWFWYHRCFKSLHELCDGVLTAPNKYSAKMEHQFIYQEGDTQGSLHTLRLLISTFQVSSPRLDARALTEGKECCKLKFRLPSPRFESWSLGCRLSVLQIKLPV